MRKLLFKSSAIFLLILLSGKLFAQVSNVELRSPAGVGDTAPDLKMVDRYLQPLKMSEINSKFLVVVFWDPSCWHCQRDMPKIDSVYRLIRNKYDIEIFGVNTNRNKDEWVDFITKHNIDWINVWDPGDTSDFRKLYDIYSTPSIYVLDKDRKVLAKKIKTDELCKTLDDIARKEENDLAVNPLPMSIMCYPNPASQQTTVVYRVTSSSDVTLELFDMLGRKVKTIVNENTAVGRYHVAVDVSDIPPGNYFFRLSLLGSMLSQKFLVVR